MNMGGKYKMKDICEVTCIHEDKVNHVQDKLKEKKPMDVAKVFKALSDDTRVKIAYALTLEEELCVCDIANIIGSTTATASHHLRLLRNLGLAEYRKEGKLVYYAIHDPHFKNLISIAFEDHKEGEIND